jgi:hypothetical protein
MHDVPLFVFFAVAYYRKYGVLSNRYMDISQFVSEKVVPPYVTEYVYELRDEKAKASHEE